MRKTIIISPTKPLIVTITPLALAIISDDFHNAAEKLSIKDRISLVKYYLYLAAIERGLKAAILSKEFTKEKKGYLKNRIGHDIERLYQDFKKSFALDLFNKSDLKSLKKANARYRDKGFEYFDSDMLYQAAIGFKDLPSLEGIRSISKKVNAFLIRNKSFIEQGSS